MTSSGVSSYLEPKAEQRDLLKIDSLTTPCGLRSALSVPKAGMTVGGCVAVYVGTLVRLGRALGRNDGREFGEYVGWAGFLPMRFGLRDIYFLYGKLSVVFG